jgi:hypothetical protein
MDKYKDIRAYHVGGILQVTDFIVVMPLLNLLAKKTTSSLELDLRCGHADLKGGALFLSNHRDIVMDAAFLSLLLRTRMNIRPYMGIGNNLYGRWWLETFFKFNRCFTVLRDGSPRDLLQHSQHLSDYMHHLRTLRRSIWLAQREGRAKDGNDRTQEGVLKMLCIGGGHTSTLNAIREMNICPTCISYEYDPCDYLKAAEMQLKRDNPAWKKSKEDDIVSMKTGVLGQKGRVTYRITPSINHWLDQHAAELETLPRNQQLQAIAQQIDRQIHGAYEIYERGKEFDDYIESRIALIDVPHKDTAFLREKLYEMYNNPVINHEKSSLPG